jgi:hypothetical protein
LSATTGPHTRSPSGAPGSSRVQLGEQAARDSAQSVGMRVLPASVWEWLRDSRVVKHKGSVASPSVAVAQGEHAAMPVVRVILREGQDKVYHDAQASMHTPDRT